MSFNPDNYDLKKLSEYPEIEFGNDLPDSAFVPVVSLDENDALANYKIPLAQIRDFIIQTGDYTNVIDYRPTPYYSAAGLQLTINGGWRLECPNGFLQTGEYQNDDIEIADARQIDLSNQGAGQWVLFVTADNTYIVRKSNLLIRKSRASETAPETGTILYEVSTNTWWRYSGTAWNQLIGMPLINVEIASGAMSVALTNSLMRNRLNLEYLLLQAGIEIPESRGPFERIISNVKKSGADLLYYIPAHTEVDLANYPETLTLLQSAYQRAIASPAKTLSVPNDSNTYNFYRDEQTGLDFAALTPYSNFYALYGYAPFIGYSGSGSVFWTPKTSHGECVFATQTGTNSQEYEDNSSIRIYADGWVEMGGVIRPTSGQWKQVPLPIKMASERNYNIWLTGILGITSAANSSSARITTIGSGVAGTAKTSTYFTAMIASTSGTSGAPIEWNVSGFADSDALAAYPNVDSYNEYYLIGNRLSAIPADLAGQLATILNNYNQIVQQGAGFFSIQAADSAAAEAASIQNPTKFVYVADS